jgi:Cu/Ag efflux pump CusA
MPFRVLEDLRKIPVKNHAERSILLGQVAQIVEGPQFKRGDGSVNGHPGVVFTVVKQPHVDTRSLTDSLEVAFAEAEASLPADIIINSELFRLKNFIDRGIFNVGEALVIGACSGCDYPVSVSAELPHDVHHAHRDSTCRS